MTQKENQFLYQIIQSLKLVASNPDVQIQLLPYWVHTLDEIALTIEDNAFLIRQILEAGLINSDQAEAFYAVERLLSDMSAANDKRLWTVEELKSHPKWEEARTLAKEALRKLGHEPGEPDLRWITYIPGKNDKTND